MMRKRKTDNEVKESISEIMQQKRFFQSLKSGVQTHGGFGLGMERLLTVVTSVSKMSDVIAFPCSRDGRITVLGPTC